MNDELPYNKIPGEGFIEKMLYLNSIEAYITCAAVIVVGISIAAFVRRILKSRLKDSKGNVASYYVKLDNYIFPIIYVLICFAALHALDKPIKAEKFIGYTFTVAFILLATRLFAATVRVAIYGYLAHQETTSEKVKQIRGIILILNGILWVIGLILLFDNLGFNVTAVLTGLGVGGIAIALAAQTILGDIFNYFVIFFDRPFEVSDFIIVGDKMGVVEYVGLKTTRLRSLSGEQIIYSNSNLTNSIIHNYKRMQERRIVFKFGVLYDTGSVKLTKIPQIVKTIIENQDNTRFDRAHFASFGEYSLDFECVYYIKSADYNYYMNAQQAINLELYKIFEENQIEFAFPTYSLRMNGKIKDRNNGLEYFISEQ
ncbi:MAG: mechanosensitive ion channel family protein [Chryseolinea sp.]